jgi:uncharacterized membrane protein
MTAETIGAAPPRAPIRFKPVQFFAAVGCAFVLLCSLAALSAVLVGWTPAPQAFRSWIVVAHLLIVLSALPLSIVQFALPKGTQLHRVIGLTWCFVLVAASLVSFGVHEINGCFSPPHAFAISSLFLVPTIIFLARKGWHKAHRNLVLGYVLFFLVAAGLFTFIPGRAMGDLLASLWS